jgi:hypothetical protein
MRRNLRAILYGILAGFWLAVGLVAPAHAQVARSTIPTFGLTQPQPQQSSDEEALSVTASNVGIIDPALPMTMLRLRFDDAFHNPRPSRAEFIQAKPAFLGGRGQPLAETNLAYQELETYVEYAWVPFFSTFVGAPYRWINPDINANSSGYGDMTYGFKMCTWNSESIMATLQFRLYNPTGGTGLGTGHWSAEPALTGAYQITEQFLLEGEARYWVPLGGSDFAGDVVRYGLGLSYGQRTASGFWYCPVVEGVGWSVLGGKALAASSPTNFYVQDAHGQTIFNGYLGLRLGLGSHLDSYLGYGRCFTGDTWQRDFARFEVRLIY